MACHPGEDQRGGEDDGARDPAGPEPVTEDHRGEDRAGERLEQGQQCGGPRRGRPQATEVQRVGHGRGAGAERGQQAEGGRAGGEAQPAGNRGHRQQDQAAEGEPEAGRGQVVQARDRPGADQRERGEPGGGEDRQARAGQHRALRDTASWQADQQAEANQREAGGATCEPADPALAAGPLDGQHDDRGTPDGDQGGQADRAQRDGREIAALEHRGQQADSGDAGPGGPPGWPAPPRCPPASGQHQEGDDQRAAHPEPVSRHRQGGQAGAAAQQAAGQAAGSPQQPGHHQVDQARSRPAADRRGHGRVSGRRASSHGRSLLRREGEGRGSGARLQAKNRACESVEAKNRACWEPSRLRAVQAGDRAHQELSLPRTGLARGRG